MLLRGQINNVKALKEPSWKFLFSEKKPWLLNPFQFQLYVSKIHNPQESILK